MSGREGKLTLLVSSTSLESKEGAVDDLGYPVDAKSEEKVPLVERTWSETKQYLLLSF